MKRALLVLIFLGCLSIINKEGHFGLDNEDTYLVALAAFVVFVLIIISWTKKN